MKKNDNELRVVKNAEGEFRIQKGTVLKYVGESEKVTIPKGVVRIAPYAFSQCKNLKTLITPVKLSSIGKGAFYGCDNLKEVTIPGRLYRRVNGGKAFPKDADIYFRFYATSGDPLEDDDYSDVYNSEAEYLASGADDVKLAFSSPAAPENAGGEGEGEGEGGSGENENGVDVSFADEVQDEHIITVEEDIPEEPEVEMEEDLDPETLQEKMDAIIPEEDNNEDDMEPLKRHELVNLSDYLIEDDKVIKYIGAAKETTVPKFISQIAENAFSNTDVKVVHLPERLEVIGKNAFSWCQNLTDLVLPETVHMIDDGAFSNCSSLASINLPRSLKFIGANAFRACCSLKSVDLPASLTAISRRAFDFCIELERVTVPEGITVLSEGVFSHCEELTKVVLPESLRFIEAWAFADCTRLREIKFPASLERIGEVAFLNCQSLVAFDLPRGLKSIGRQAFCGCSSLHLVNMSVKLEPQLKPTKAFHKVEKLSISFYEEN